MSAMLVYFISDDPLTATRFVSHRLVPILISRFMLNLRAVDCPPDGATSTTLSQFSMPGFRVPTSVTGTLGGELGYDDDWQTEAQTETECDEPAIEEQFPTQVDHDIHPPV